MRVVVQRVSEARVIINGEITAKINSGLLILLGVGLEDSQEDIDWLCRKIVALRIFNDADGVMNISALDNDAEVLVVSQFTLHASTKKGNRPSYIKAAKPEDANILYKQFVKTLSEKLNKTVFTGVFGADMKVHLINDGPVTIFMDSKNKE